MFAILSSFYNFCLQEEVAQVNPVALIRQKSKFIRTESTAPVIRRLSEKQWQTVIHIAKEKAKKDEKHERTVFILSCLYGMISNPRTPITKFRLYLFAALPNISVSGPDTRIPCFQYSANSRRSYLKLFERLKIIAPKAQEIYQ